MLFRKVWDEFDIVCLVREILFLFNISYLLYLILMYVMKLELLYSIWFKVV